MKPPLPDRAVRSAAAPPVAFRSGVVLAKPTTADARSSSAVDLGAAGEAATGYSAEALNRYAEIVQPARFPVSGRAPAEVAVSVDGEPATRQGPYWHGLAERPGPHAAQVGVTVEATLPGGGEGGADLETLLSGERFAPPLVESPQHDEDGNLVSDARWVYSWDAADRLVAVETGPAALLGGAPKQRRLYAYDSRSRRIARTVESWDLDAGAWVLEKSERFVHDDWNVVAVVDAAGEVVQRYVWGNDLSGTPQGAGGVGGLLAAADAASGRSWCYAYDGNGNVSAVVDLADRTKVGRYDYDAFGRTIAMWGDGELAEVNSYRFSTKPLEGTGLYYYGFRWYEPGTGRWLSRDPIEENGGVNLYGFVGNDGVGRLDALGLLATDSISNSLYTPGLSHLAAQTIAAGRVATASRALSTFLSAYVAYSVAELAQAIEVKKAQDIAEKVRDGLECPSHCTTKIWIVTRWFLTNKLKKKLDARVLRHVFHANSPLRESPLLGTSMEQSQDFLPRHPSRFHAPQPHR